MITLSEFLHDPVADTANARVKIADLQKWTCTWAMGAVRDARPELTKAIVDLVISQQRENIAAMLPPEEIAKCVRAGVVEAVAQMVKAAADKPATAAQPERLPA